MADVPDDEEFRLPSEFLPDDLFMENDSLRTAVLRPVSMKLPSEFFNEFDSFGFGSVLSSPVESTVSSSEAESCDEDFLAVLTQRLAQSSLSETKMPATPFFCQNQPEKKTWYASGSPQSTLVGIGNFLYPRTMSGNGSPDGPFQFPSPPETPFVAEKDSWERVYSATKRVGGLTGDTNTISLTRSYPSRCTGTLPYLKSSSSGSFSDPRLFRYLPQSSQCGRYEQVSKEECSLECRKLAAFSVLQQRRHRFDTGERNNMHENGRCEPSEALDYHPWRPQNQSKQPQHTRSILQPHFNGGTAVKRESVGTGVFLPRSYANPPEQRKQTGFPTDRPVKVHEFGFSLKDTNERKRGPSDDKPVPNYAPKYGISISTQQRHELLLPLEWNY